MVGPAAVGEVLVPVKVVLARHGLPAGREHRHGGGVGPGALLRRVGAVYLTILDGDDAPLMGGKGMKGQVGRGRVVGSR